MKKLFVAALFLLLPFGVFASVDDVRVGNPSGKNFTPDVYQRIGWTGEGQKPPQALSPAELANTLMGADSIMRYSHGNTYPAVALPFGMNFWSPQTGVNGYGWSYTYRGGQIRGLKQTHQPSPWIGDYGAFSLMPITAPLLDQFSRASSFNHASEVAKPYLYSVRLDTWRITAEVTATERAAVFRFTYPKAAPAFVVLDTMGVGGRAVLDRQARTLAGFVTNNRGGVPKNFRNYFIVQFDQEVVIGGGGNIGWALLKPGPGGVVTVRAASSFISPEQARLNLEREVGNKSFDEVMAEAKAVWEKELGRIEVSGGTLEERATFYSTLYRLLLFPRKFYELDETGKIIHYSPYDGKAHDGYMFTDNGFWDTFRAVYPFFTIMYPELDGQIMQGLINAYKEGGWLPSWASPGYRDCMIGAHAASLLADAYVKGIRDFDAGLAWEAMVKDATQPDAEMKFRGRYDVELYNQYGYIPYDRGASQNVARTLEYAYDDFCMYAFARATGRPESDWAIYRQRAMNYKNLFDPSVGFMRGKKADGSWRPDFNEFKWGEDYTEGGAWHYTWSVFQDPAGLIALFGNLRAMYHVHLGLVLLILLAFGAARLLPTLALASVDYRGSELVQALKLTRGHGLALFQGIVAAAIPPLVGRSVMVLLAKLLDSPAAIVVLQLLAASFTYLAVALGIGLGAHAFVELRRLAPRG